MGSCNEILKHVWVVFSTLETLRGILDNQMSYRKEKSAIASWLNTERSERK